MILLEYLEMSGCVRMCQVPKSSDHMGGSDEESRGLGEETYRFVSKGKLRKKHEKCIGMHRLDMAGFLGMV